MILIPTGQAGTIVSTNGENIQVLLRSGEIWTGASNQCRQPQSEADLAAAPIIVDRPEPRRKRNKQ